jgi:cobalt-precorrin 5A hydrolase/precorrin-3B C17-methyltransferase
LNRVVCCSVTEAGAALARKLPFEHRAGHLIQTVRAEWASCDGLVLIAATGIAVRAIAPLLSDKEEDPAVVCVDDGGCFSVALAGGHHGGGNQLAREVADLIGATPVVTTATDAAGLPALDTLPGYRAEGDIAGVTRRWLDGRPPAVRVDDHLSNWRLPAFLMELKGTAAGGQAPVVTVTDADRSPGVGEVLLRPSTTVVGVGASTGADPDGLRQLVDYGLAGAGVSVAAVGAIATIDRKRAEPALVALASGLGVDCLSFTAARLAAMQVPNPSDVVLRTVGTPSVAEAAALAAAGPGAVLLLTKTVSATGDSTVAVARRAQPQGHLAVVGLGPGRRSALTLEASAAIRHAEVVVGYAAYVDLASGLLDPRQEVLRSPIGAERQRCLEALRLAAGGRQVALVCSGDPGVYAMASLACEMAAEAGDPPITVVPGVTAAQSAAALLGAPLGHDFAAISLSDLLTPWDVIARRLQAAAEGDFVVALYNPRSTRRTSQLPAALEILVKARPATTPAAIVSSVGRPGERVVRGTIASLDPEDVDMMSLVIVGSSLTRWMGDHMVTPRGYECR